MLFGLYVFEFINYSNEIIKVDKEVLYLWWFKILFDGFGYIEFIDFYYEDLMNCGFCYYIVLLILI